MVTTLQVSAIKKFRGALDGTGCFVLYHETKFFVSVKHAFWANAPTNELITVQVCRNERFNFTGHLFLHEQADVGAVRLVHEGFEPRHYIHLDDAVVHYQAGHFFCIVGYDNIVPANCQEIPLLQPMTFREHQGIFRDVFDTLVVPGYSGSTIFSSPTATDVPELIGLVSKNVKTLHRVGNSLEREEGDEVIVPQQRMISATRQAIIETLSMAI